MWPFFKPNLRKLALPVGILVLSIFPTRGISLLVFETLSYPFGNTLHRLRYNDIPYLTHGGVIIVAAIWAAVFYALGCCAALLWSKLRAKEQ